MESHALQGQGHGRDTVDVFHAFSAYSSLKCAVCTATWDGGTFLKFCCILPAPKTGGNFYKSYHPLNHGFSIRSIDSLGPVASLRFVTRSQY